jgi:ElaB/YqjD/DUF883 family membrane-anchored ribosome-binding protein
MSRGQASNSERHADSATDELKEAAVGLGSNMRDMGGHIREAAREQVDHLRDRAKDYVDQGRRKARDLESGLEAYVQQKPIKSLLIAAGAGLVIGYLWHRR